MEWTSSGTIRLEDNGLWKLLLKVIKLPTSRSERTVLITSMATLFQKSHLIKTLSWEFMDHGVSITLLIFNLTLNSISIMRQILVQQLMMISFTRHIWFLQKISNMELLIKSITTLHILWQLMLHMRHLKSSIQMEDFAIYPSIMKSIIQIFLFIWKWPIPLVNTYADSQLINIRSSLMRISNLRWLKELTRNTPFWLLKNLKISLSQSLKLSSAMMRRSLYRKVLSKRMNKLIKR